MKKLYSLVALMVAIFTATSASAKIQSAADLFGTWTLTADIQYVDESFKDKILSESEVIIQKDNITGYSAAEIDNLFGIANSYQLVSKMETQDGKQVLKIVNPNGGNYDSFNFMVYMAEPGGHNPSDWQQSYGPLYYVVNDEGTEITLPDFAFVTIDWQTNNVTIVAQVKNAKLTLKEKEVIEIKDLSGEYDLNINIFQDYQVFESWPTNLKMNIVKKDDTNKNYSVTWAWEEFAPITFDGTFDGNALTLPYSKQVVAYDSIYLAPTYDYNTLDGNIVFNLEGDHLKMSTGCSFAVPHYLDGATEPDTLSYVFWYGGGIAKLPKEEPAFDYAGTYKAKGVVTYDPQVMEVNTEGDIVIEFNDQYNAYIVKEFLGYKNPFTLNNDFMYLVPDAEDPLKATLTPACLAFLSQTDDGNDYRYLVTRDVNLQEYSVPVEFDNDGNMTIKDISFATTTMMGTEPEKLVIFFSAINAIKYNPSPDDWIGDHEVTPIEFAYVANGFEVPTAKTFKVSYNDSWGKYLIDDLFGYDVFTTNQGGIELKPDKIDPHKAIIVLEAAYNLLDFNVETFNAIALYDTDMNTTSIEATLNDDGTVTLGDFSIAEGPWGGEPTNLLASTKIPASINDVKTSEAEGKTYNLQGVEVKGQQRGIVIQNVGGKFVKKYIK